MTQEEITTGTEGFDPASFTIPCDAGDGDIQTLQNFLTVGIKVVRDVPYFPPEEYGTDRGRLSGSPEGSREGLNFHNWTCLGNYVGGKDDTLKVFPHVEDDDPYNEPGAENPPQEQE